MSYTISITSVGAGISSIHWMRYGNNSMGVEVMFEDGYLYQGGSLSKTADSGYLKLDVTTRSGYTNPTYYRSTPSYYEQNLNDDKIISFNANKSGYIKAQASTTYTITYNANGGSGAPAAQTGITPTASVTLRTDTPRRTFYNFLGWSTSSTATSATYQPGQTITVYSNMTLYAVWEYDGATLTYDANGGSGAPNAITQRRGTTFTVSSTAPTRAGFTFNGWFRGTNQQTYYGGDTLILNRDETISAKWQAVTYSVNFRDNDGTFIMSRTTTGSFTFPSYSKTGYTFKGWSLSSTPTYVTYYASNTYTVSSNISVYAVYTVDLSFSADGASNVPSSKYGYVGSGSSYTCTIPDDVPTKSGYTFLYWVRYNDDDSYSTFSPGASITLYKNTTLYAQFAVTTYSVTLSLGRGISSVNIAYQASNGSITTITGITSSRSVAVKSGGAFRVTSATLSTGYQNASVDFYDSPDFTTPIATVSINESRTINFTQYANVVSSKVTLTKFAFHFSGSTDVDGNYFTTGSSVSDALTADSWNSLNQKITQVEAALGITQTSYTTISRNDTISATLFNQVRNRINGLTSHGTLPTTQSANDTITPSLFIGSVSLKKALNDAIDAFNNN